MTKKSKATAKKAKKTLQIQQDLLQTSLLLGFTRQPKSAKEQGKLLFLLEQELQLAYEIVRHLSIGSVQEEDALAEIRDLENRRFALLSAMHGNKVQAYKVKRTNR